MSSQRVRKEIKNSTLYLLVTKPSFYIKRLAGKTLLIGLFSLLVNLIFHYCEWDKHSIPTGMHSVIGIVIGLLLVFRTNTAYDRWWEGRKTISLLAGEIGTISARISTDRNRHDPRTIQDFENILDRFLCSLRDYLQLGDDGEESSVFHCTQKRIITESMRSLKNINLNDREEITIEGSLGKILEYSNSLERIKNTPIPLSYALHIRMSILIYVITLPFGLFHELGLWSSLMVMLVYYIISGVEIISNEIENPFAGDPNDLPLDVHFDNILKTLKDKENLEI